MARVSVLRTAAAAATAIAVAAASAIALTDSSSVNTGGFTCNSTLSSGANVATAVAALPAGQTLCLNAGSYTGFTFQGSYPFSSNEVSKASMTTIRPSPGVVQAQVTMTGFVGRSNNLTIRDVTMAGGAIGTPSAGDTAATNLTFQNIHYTGCFILYQPDSTVMNITLDGGLFDTTGNSGNGSICGDDGRIRVNGLNTGAQSATPNINIKNIDFSGQAGCTDGIEFTGGATKVVVGPGNTFHGIMQNNPTACTTHVDPVQFYGASSITVDSNYFYNNTDGILTSNGNGDGAIVTNNVFGTNGDAYPYAVVDCGQDGGRYEHNTFNDDQLNLCASTSPADSTSGVIVRNNYMAAGMTGQANSGQVDYTGETATFNMCPSGTALCNNGAGGVAGTAVFVGGSTPSVFSGFFLASASPGFLAASDGLSIGVH